MRPNQILEDSNKSHRDRSKNYICSYLLTEPRSCPSRICQKLSKIVEKREKSFLNIHRVVFFPCNTFRGRFTTTGSSRKIFYFSFCRDSAHMGTLGDQWFQNSPEARKTGISDATKISGAQISTSRSQLTLLVPESPRMYALARQVVRPQLQAVKATHSGLTLYRLARKCASPTPKSEIPLFPASWRPL